MDCQHIPLEVVSSDDPLDADLLSHCRECHVPLRSVLRHVGDEDRVPTWGPWRPDTARAA